MNNIRRGLPLARARVEQIFPKLTPKQIRRIIPHGRTRTTERGEVLYEQGDSAASFFVVVSGELEVVRPSGAVETLVTIHRPGQFTGEVGTLSGRRTMFRIRATKPGKVIELDRQNMLTLVQTDAELGEILMRAFILRRGELITAGIGDIVLIGSTYSADTLRIIEFLMRNGHPYSYIDVEHDPDVQNMLDSFHLFLAEAAKRVHMLVRSVGLAKTKSSYLIRRIEVTPNIVVQPYTEILALQGGDHLESVRWRNNQTGLTEEHKIRHVFLMTGADPNTGWLNGCLALDARSFIKTGPDLSPENLGAARWPLVRQPFLLETSLPGVFAVGERTEWKY
jgi:hypothetical protein